MMINSAHFYVQFAPGADLERAVVESAPAPTMGRAIPSTGPVSATLAGSAVTARSVSGTSPFYLKHIYFEQIDVLHSSFPFQTRK